MKAGRFCATQEQQHAFYSVDINRLLHIALLLQVIPAATP